MILDFPAQYDFAKLIMHINDQLGNGLDVCNRITRDGDGKMVVNITGLPPGSDVIIGTAVGSYVYDGVPSPMNTYGLMVTRKMMGV